MSYYGSIGYHKELFLTFGTNTRIRNIVVSEKIPTTNIPVPMLMYLTSANVSRAITAIVMLEI